MQQGLRGTYNGQDPDTLPGVRHLEQSVLGPLPKSSSQQHLQVGSGRSLLLQRFCCGAGFAGLWGPAGVGRPTPYGGFLLPADNIFARPLRAGTARSIRCGRAPDQESKSHRDRRPLSLYKWKQHAGLPEMSLHIMASSGRAYYDGF